MTVDQALLSAAQNGDARSFESMVAPFRAGLKAHCYRLLGSMSDADDVVQDALVRAWRGVAGFDGRGSLRGWLFQIATNVCLTEIERRPRRRTVDELVPAAGPMTPLGDVAWLEPCGAEVWSEAPGPEAVYSARESVAVAFLTLLQSLPAQQRAVLVFRDVMGWSAVETAAALETTVAAVNSALQRARVTMEAWQEHEATAPRDEGQVAALLKRYVTAWETGDAKALAELLHEDARLTMPPLQLWLAGRSAIAPFVGQLMGQFGQVRLLAFEANGGPAAAMYVRAEGQADFVAQSLQVLSLAADGSLSRIDVFMNPAAFERFGLPASVTAVSQP